MTDPEQQLRSLFRRAGADIDAASAVAQLEGLLDAALAQAELNGIRLLARTLPHELAQPLTEIRGYAELLAEGAIPADEQPQIVDWIQDAAARAGELMHRVARLARPDATPPARRMVGDQELLVLPDAEP